MSDRAFCMETARNQRFCAGAEWYEKKLESLSATLEQAFEPWCDEGGGQAVNGTCPTHNGDACLKTPEGLIKRIECLTSLVPLAFYDGFNASNCGEYVCSDDAFDDSAPIIQACYKK